MFKFNFTTGQLDLVGNTGTGSGDVTGPSSSDDRAIARFDGTTGKLIQNSPGTYVQDGGGVQMQAVLSNRLINETVTIPTNYTMLASNIDLEDGEIIIEEDGELLIL